MMSKKVLFFVSLVLLTASFIFFSPIAFGQDTLMYDDGIPVGYYETTAGDVELVTFTPAHPCRVTAIRFRFMGTPAETDIYIWADYAGGWPDMENEPLFHTTVTPLMDDWTEIAIPEGEVTIDPPANFYAGQILSTDGLHIAVDSSEPEGGNLRSKLRMGSDWYGSSSGDLMVRADVEYFNVVETPTFTNVSAEAGFEGISPSRVAWGDYDADGDDDLLVVGSRLFRNDGGVFSDVTVEAGIREVEDEVICGGSGGVWADYDNDGFLDFYSISHGFVSLCEPGEGGDWYCNAYSDGEIPQCLDGYCRNEGDPWPKHDCLFHNEGDGTFTVAPEEGSPYDFSPTEGAAWGDYDNDGFVDLYVANYEMPTSWTGESRLGVGTPDILWHNNGDSTFTDVSEEALPGDCRRGSGRGVNWGDYNDDGLIDIFVSVYRLQPNCLWLNNGSGTFTEVSRPAGVQGVPIGGQYGHTIGSQWMDYDNDGDLDMFSANLAHPRFIDFSDKSMLLVNSGPPDYTFVDVREESGIIFQETHSEPAWGDYDNDGLVDLYITDVYVGQLSQMYRQLPDNAFEDVTYVTGTAVDNGWGAAWADMDDDGDLDLASRSIFRNDNDNDNHWLKIHLEGTDSNRAAIGARVDVTCGSVTRSRQVEGGKGTTNQNSLTLHFGLGDCELVDQLTVTWPSGLVESAQNIEADQRLDFVEGSVVVSEEAVEEIPEDASSDAQEDLPMDDAAEDEDEGEGKAGSGCSCRTIT